MGYKLLMLNYTHKKDRIFFFFFYIPYNFTKLQPDASERNNAKNKDKKSKGGE